MGMWDDRVANHPVNGAFTTVLDLLENVNEERRAAAPEALDRVAWVLEHVRARLTRAPAVAVPGPALDAVLQQVNQVHAELSNYDRTGNETHLQNANTYADTMLESVRALPPLSVEGAEDVAAAALDRTRNLVATVVEAAEAEVSRLRGTAETFQQTTEASRDAFTAQASGAEEQVAALRAEVDALTTQLEAALAAHQTRFDEGEGQRAEAAQEAARKAEVMFEATDSELQQNAEGTLQELRKRDCCTDR